MTAPLSALVLTAGLGTRLDPLTQVRAKPAVPVAGEPLIRRIVTWLVANGITDVTCNLHHLPHTLTAVLGDGRDLGASVRYSWEQPHVLGSAGGPRQALGIVGTDPLLIVNGDTLTDVPLDRLRAAHEERGASVTLALTPNHAPDRYGGVRLHSDGRVSGFVRRGASAEGSFHFVGVQIAAAGVFADIPQGHAASTIGGVYDALIASRPGAVRGLVVDAAFHDIGSVTDYLRTSHALAQGRPIVGRHFSCAPSAQVTRSIVWDDVSIGEHAVVDGCIVTDGVRVPDGAAFGGAILLSDSHGRLRAVPLPAES